MPAPRWFPRRFRTPGPWPWVLGIGCLLSLGAWMVASALLRAQARERLGRSMEQAGDRLTSRLRGVEGLLRAIQGLADADGRISPEAFRRFLDTQDLATRRPELQGITYSVRVGDGERQAFLEELRRTHPGRDLGVQPDWSPGESHVVLAAFPEATNARALGFNVLAHPVQREDALASRDEGRLWVSGPVPLVQAPGQGPGLVFRLPLYQSGSRPTTPEARREAFRGSLNAICLAEALLRPSLAALARDGVSCRLLDGPTGHLLLASDPQEPPSFWARLVLDPREVSLPLSAAGRAWRLEGLPRGGFLRPLETALPWLVLALGLQSTLLLARLLQVHWGHRQRAEDHALDVEARLDQTVSRLQAMVRVLPDVILVLDGKGQYLEVYTGEPGNLARPLADLLGRHLEEVLPPDVAQLMHQQVQLALREGGVHGCAYDLVTVAGPRSFEARVVPLDRQGTGTVVWVARDVTDRRRVEEDHARLQAQLVQAQKLESIGCLAGGVAHDLNNMLSPIFGYTELIQSDLPPEDPRQPFLECILQSAHRSRNLVRQLLAFARRQTLDTRPLDLNALVEQFIPMLQRTLREDVRLELRLDRSLGTVVGDAGQLEQVLLNLVLNAQDAMPEGGRLTVHTDRRMLDPGDPQRPLDLAPGPYVRMVVEDTGFGMDEATLARAFEPFYTTKGTGRGTGLGLSTAHGIARQHGGTLEALSLPGQGTRMALLLPESDRQVPVPASLGPLRVQGGPETLLLVEDEPEVRRLVALVLREAGYGVLEAGTVAEARDTCEVMDRLDLLLTDVILPDGNGRALAADLAGRRPGLRVVYMSGYTADVLAPHGVLEAGIAYLQKPFSNGTLLEKVREVLGNHGSR